MIIKKLACCFALFVILLFVTFHYYISPTKWKSTKSKEFQQITSCKNNVHQIEITEVQNSKEKGRDEATLKPCSEFHPRCWYWPELSILYKPPESHLRFYEETTASRFYPINILRPDSSWALNYFKYHALVYKDYGPGCITRIFTERIYNESISAQLVLDNASIYVNFFPTSFTDGKTFPYFHPLSKIKNATFGYWGYTLQFPFCYQTSAEVYIVHADPKFKDFNTTMTALKHCAFKDKRNSCDRKYIGLYAIISAIRMPFGAEILKPFSIENYRKLEQTYRELADYLVSKSNSVGTHCLGKNVTFSGSHTLYSCEGKSGVINLIEIEVNNDKDLFWLHTFITIIVDNDDKMINYVSLNGLFGINTINDTFQSVVNGISQSPCNAGLFRGAFKLPIPFKKSVHVIIHSRNLSKIFYDISVNFSTLQEHTSRLKIVQTIYKLQPPKNAKVLLNEYGSTGRYVGIALSLWNPVRYPYIETDIDIWKDGLNLPVSYGTGLEDHFGYSKSCRGSLKSLYFFGCTRKSDFLHNLPMSLRFYRYHFFDPVFFYSSLEIALEGEGKNIRLEKNVPADEMVHLDAKKVEFITATVFLYIEKSKTRQILVDKFEIGNRSSRSLHQFSIKEPNLDCNVVGTAQYTGSKHRTTNIKPTVCNVKSPFTINFRARSQKDLIIRRHFHCVPYEWNEEANVFLNNKFIGRWFVPKSSLNATNQFCDYEIAIDKKFLKNINHLKLQPLTKWRDFKLEFFAIV